MLHEECQLLPTFQRVGDRVTRNGLRQNSPRSLHRKQQRLQFLKNRGHMFLPQRMAVFQRQLLLARLTVDRKQFIHERDDAFQFCVGGMGLGLHLDGLDKFAP